MNDIVQRLNSLEGWNTTGPKALMFEAADEIERLRKERNDAIQQAMNANENADHELRLELSALKAKIEALQPVAWMVYEAMDNELAGYEFYKSDQYGGKPLYDLGDLK